MRLVLSAQRRCLDAFVVALSQCYEGGEKRWYSSTLQLQLASLEFCGACRSIAMLHVFVDAETPPTLWSLGQANPTAVTSTRVPAVRAVGLTWARPTESPLGSASSELWTRLESLQLQVSLCTANLDSVVWPQGLQRLVMDCTVFMIPLEMMSWPSSLKSLTFAGIFDQPINEIVWPASIQELFLGFRFNQPISEVVWPASLQQLSFGYWFDRPLVGMLWPASLRSLSFGFQFNHPVVDVVWPASLQHLLFGVSFNQPIVGVEWPSSLQLLSFGVCFKQPIAGVVWPDDLRELSFGDHFNQPISEVVWPSSLQHLSF
ncbi:unnamed protein product, partial [Ectocarpus sp. 12 AP-2014]